MYITKTYNVCANPSLGDAPASRFNITDEELVLPSTSLQEAIVERMALKEVLPGNQGKPPKQKKKKKASKKQQQQQKKK